ncbi:MFS transporter [soil metagenome]
MQGDSDPRKWRALALLGSAELLGMSLWFSASAVSPQLAAAWGLSASEAGWLTTVVQLGFVAGTAVAATLNLADIVRSRTLFALAALAGAAVNAAVVTTDDYEAALVLRFFTGFCLAGVYPPAMKMISTWFSAQRGLAIGTIVGALTIGKATPYLVNAIPDAGVVPVLLTASACAVLAALLVWTGYRDGPYAFASRPFSWGLVASVARVREWRLATASYLGHMFELYAVWTWIPAFLAASVLARDPDSTAPVTLISFLAIAIGGAGCVWGGLFADRAGRERLVTISLLASGACCALSALFFGASLWLLAPFALAWGFFVIADSAQFSTLVTESVPPHAVGTALTMQTSLGFLLTMLPMQLVPVFAARVGWRWSLVFLALGPAAGIFAIKRLARVRTSNGSYLAGGSGGTAGPSPSGS